MSTATIAGTVTFPISVGGPSAAMVLGSPDVNPDSTTGPTLTFSEQMCNTYSVTIAASPFTVPFGSITSGDILYIGTDQALTVLLNGGAESFSIAAGGFIMIYLGSCTGAVLTATTLDAVVQVALLGSE